MDALPPPPAYAVVQETAPATSAGRPWIGAAARRTRPSPEIPAVPASVEAHGPNGVYANIPERDDRGRDQLAMFRAWNPDPIGNHERNLAAVKPALAAVVRKAEADNPGLRFVVGSGVRSEAEQRLAGLWGWSPWPAFLPRNPQLRKHIEGEAVDLWPLDAASRVTFDPALQRRVAAAMKKAARDLGVRMLWGGEWASTRKDPPHFELR